MNKETKVRARPAAIVLTPAAEARIAALMSIIENRDGVATSKIYNIGNPANNFSVRELANMMLDLARRHLGGAIAREAAASLILSPQAAGLPQRGPVAGDPRVARALEDAGVERRAIPGTFVIDDVDGPRTGDGRPYTIYSPYARRHAEVPRREVLGAPRALHAVPGLEPGAAGRGVRRTPSVVPAPTTFSVRMPVMRTRRFCIHSGR